MSTMKQNTMLNVKQTTMLNVKQKAILKSEEKAMLKKINTEKKIPLRFRVAVVINYLRERNFQMFSGGKKRGDVVFVGDCPDARHSDFLVETKILANQPSYRHSRFKQGYVLLRAGIPFAGHGKDFDLASQTVNGKRAYFFGKRE